MNYIDNPIILAVTLNTGVKGPVYKKVGRDREGNEIVAPVFIIRKENKEWERKKP